MSAPAKPSPPRSLVSLKTGAASASVTLSWNAVIETGGVPLIGYEVYSKLLSTGTKSLVFDGINHPEILETTVSNLILDEDYEFTVSALNQVESEESEPLVIRAAGLPD